MVEANIWDNRFDEQSDAPDTWIDEPSQDEETPISTDVVTLLNLGELRDRLDIRGHEIWLKTLKIDEELEIGILIQPYVNTIEEGRALATATVAAAIHTLDGKPLVNTIGPDDNLLQRKFNYIRAHMYWPVIKIIYEEGYIPLVQKQVDSILEFRKK